MEIIKSDAIGIIGGGFVGKAIAEGMRHAFHIEIFDIDTNRTTVKSLDDLIALTKTIFVCVPTPMSNITGECDFSIVSNVLEDLNRYSDLLVVIKSTLSPGTTAELEKQFSNLQIVFNPEFLTEANAIEDFKNQNRIIIGSSDSKAIERISIVYQKSYPNVPIFVVDAVVAEMAKYTANCYLAVKVSFANEIFQICEALKIDYNAMIQIAQKDERLGNSHWKVPGPVPSVASGKLLPGFSGTCLVKEINSAIFLAKKLGIDPKVMLAAWEKNLEIRPEHDWELQIGRAISHKKANE